MLRSACLCLIRHPLRHHSRCSRYPSVASHTFAAFFPFAYSCSCPSKPWSSSVQRFQWVYLSYIRHRIATIVHATPSRGHPARNTSSGLPLTARQPVAAIVHATPSRCPLWPPTQRRTAHPPFQSRELLLTLSPFECQWLPLRVKNSDHLRAP